MGGAGGWIDSFFSQIESSSSVKSEDLDFHTKGFRVVVMVLFLLRWLLEESSNLEMLLAVALRDELRDKLLCKL
jgi:hypothetical protein